MKTIETMIIGAGVAGLGCARTLTDNGYHDFQIFTKDVGGLQKRT